MNNSPMNFDSLDGLVEQTDTITARYKLYNGEIELLYDDDAHTYATEVDGVRVPAYGVTNVTGCADKPMLKPWVAKETVEAVRVAIQPFRVTNDIFEQEIRVSPAQFEALLIEAKASYKNISQKALDVGHIGHAFIEDYLKAHIAYGVYNVTPFVGQDLLDGIVDRIEKAVPEYELDRSSKVEQCMNSIVGGLKWLKDHNFRPIKAEFKVYSREFNYAGTTDAKGHMDSCSDPKCCTLQFRDWLVIADWKSSRDFYTEYRYQAAAYNQADQEETGDVKDANVVVILGKYTGVVKSVILPASEQDDDFGAFLGLMAYHERTETLGEIESLQKAVARAEKKAVRDAEKAEEAAEKAEKKAAKAAAKEEAEVAKAEKKAATVAERLRAKAAKLTKSNKKEVVTIQ